MKAARLTRESVLEHLEMLYKLNGIAKVASGDYVVGNDEGWSTLTPDEAAENLAEKLEDIDDIRRRICELGVGGFTLPKPEIVIGDRIIYFDEENEDGEPVAIIRLKDESVVEIIHREFALDLEEQFFKLKHLDETGKRLERIKGGLSDVAPALMKYVEDFGIEDDDRAICPICGTRLELPRLEYGVYDFKCSSCGTRIVLYEKGELEIINAEETIEACTATIPDNKKITLALYMRFSKDDDIGMEEPFKVFTISLDHPVTPDDYRKYTVKGFHIVEKIHEKHCLKAIVAESEVMWEETVKEA